MQRFSLKRAQNNNISEGALSVVLIFVAVQLLTVLFIYSVVFQNSETPEQAAWAPSQQIFDGRGESLSKSKVRLHEADIDLLRDEITLILASLPASHALQQQQQLPEIPEENGDTLPPANGFARLSDEGHRVNPSSNIPGVQDVHAELREYTAHILQTWTSNFTEAVGRQQRPPLDLEIVDLMDETASVPTRIEFLNELSSQIEKKRGKHLGGGVAIATTTSIDFLGLRREVLPWLQYHTELEVHRFFILYDGHDPLVVEALQSVHNVELIHIHAPFATPLAQSLWEAQKNLTRQWETSLGAQFHHQNNSSSSQGNYELMAKQGFGLQEALRRAQLSNTRIQWLLHLDPDELFYPGSGKDFSISRELSMQPPHIPAVRFMNFEAQPEVGGEDVPPNRFELVSLFRVHKHFITPEALWYRNRFKLGSNAAFLNLYANGKSAVRVHAPGVKQAGPHYFTGDNSDAYVTTDNPSGAWVNAISDTAVILHYAYCHQADVAAKAHRSCHEGGDVAGCFVIDFDKEAYLAALENEVEAFFYSRMVLSENSLVQCVGGENQQQQQQQGWCALSNISRFIHLMEKIGLYRRVLLPRVLLQQHERSIQKKLNKQTT